MELRGAGEGASQPKEFHAGAASGLPDCHGCTSSGRRRKNWKQRDQNSHTQPRRAGHPIHFPSWRPGHRPSSEMNS